MITDIVVLAAGQGTRMRSARPKVLQALGGKPLLEHVLDTAQALQPRHLHVVIGNGAELVQEHFSQWPVQWWHQQEQRGTGDALKAALPGLRGADRVLVLYGDVPL
ncbi:NTP transferase domain-containing protein, partial [Acidithiobacillus sp. HP-11]